MSFSNDDRWSDDGPECPYCGGSLSSKEARERAGLAGRGCDECANGPEKTRQTAPSTYPEISAAQSCGPQQPLYPPVRLTPEQIEDWRAQCDAFDAEQMSRAKRMNRGIDAE